MTANAWVMASAVFVSIIAFAQAAYADDVNVVANAPVRICASYLSQVGPYSLDVRQMEREVNRIWAPYGVTIEGMSEPCKTPGDGPVLKVRVRKMENVRPAGIPRGTLGNIYFVAGRPTPLIDLWADQAMRVMGGNHIGFDQGLSDPRIRQEIGRLLGRSLAHELGHYLLGSRVHTEEGLMRRVYDNKDGKASTPGRFSLDEAQVAAVEQTVAAWRTADPERQRQNAVAGGSRVTLPPSGM
jgi:hypothetical protein